MRILHVLDHSLPLHSGYTFRTRAILKAQMARGWEVACLTGARHQAASADPQTVDGIVSHRTPHRAGGPPLLREWREEIGSASCRARVCQYVWISVVAVSLKKKQEQIRTDNITTNANN